jgi:murein DD-endopeptidase MepM/ murein hydrolase activator NlpD
MMDRYRMKNKLPEGEIKAKSRVHLWILRLKENISLPVSLLLIFALGAFSSGIGFYTKSLALEKQLAGLEANMQFTELQSLRMSNEWLKNRVAVLQEERAVLLETAVADLDKKSRIIESILSSVGVDIKVEVSNKNSGGLFTGSVGDTGDELILRTDQYLETIQDVPLGAPVPGVLTSRFGWRNDPINGKRAYHRGVDIRGKKGSDVKATANGIVKTENYDRGNGRYILVDHGNGFVTKYAHMKKSLVEKGDTIARGQVIGLVGSTGRSTGPHVHYEIHYDDKIVNPTRFVRIAKYLNRSKKKK